MTVHKINDNDAKVKDALQVWAEWMQQDKQEQTLGYGRCVGFASGGSTASWEDFAAKVDKNMAVNVQAIYDGLSQPQQLAIDHFHLSAIWKPVRYKIEDMYSEALIKIEIALRRRGLI